MVVNYIKIPANSKYNKIGGKAIFKQPISGQPLLPNDTYPKHAKLMDYNEENTLYKVVYNDGNSQWIDIKDRNVIFISQRVMSYIVCSIYILFNYLYIIYIESR